MKELLIGHISDTHGLHMRMPPLEKAVNVLVHSGDVSNIGGRMDMEDFLDWFSNLPADYHVFIPGNHDLCFDPERNGMRARHEFIEWPEWLSDAIRDFQKVKTHFFLNSSSCEIEGVKFWGSPITPWFHGDYWAFNKQRGEEIKKIWSEIPMDTDVLITHGPAINKGDFTTRDKLRVGCEDLMWKIKQIKPLAHLFGHIHEGYGYSYDEHSNYFNGSICTLQYSPINDPWIFKANFDNKEIEILNEKKIKHE